MRTIYRALSGFLGAVLTLGGCSNGSVLEPDQNTAEYGVPTARYSISGLVLEQTSGLPIAGIMVNMSSSLVDTTDADGRWSLEGRSGFGGMGASLWLSDIDGSLNGSYASRFASVPLERTGPANGDDQGLFEAHGVTIEMTEAIGDDDD